MDNIARTGVKPMTLELGGKSPQLVFADADLDLAAAAIAGSILFNAGQACVAGIPPDRRGEAWRTRWQPRSYREDGGHAAPARPGTRRPQYSPIISERQIARMRRHRPMPRSTPAPNA